MASEPSSNSIPAFSSPSGGDSTVAGVAANRPRVDAPLLSQATVSQATQSTATASRAPIADQLPRATTSASAPVANGAGAAATRPVVPSTPNGGPNSGSDNSGSDKSRGDAVDVEKVGSFRWSHVVPSWLVSVIVHGTLLVILALIIQPQKFKDELKDLTAISGEQVEMIEEVSDVAPPAEVNAPTGNSATGVVGAVDVGLIEGTGVDVTDVNDTLAAPANLELGDFGLGKGPISDLTKEIGKYSGSGKGLDGRGAAARKGLVASRGGSAETEESVALALIWLSQHQNADGSWSLDHRKGGNCQGRCSHPGQPDNCNIAATALALLPFLGAGQTHKVGKYQKNVQAGLYYLVNRMKVGPNGGDLWEPGGTMYGHGLASIVLCEAYAMTQDRGLAGPAQQAINFIVYAQDPVGGGWRYMPKDKGDTSVVGWQLMALKSAHMAYLNVPPQTIRGATNFLNTVQEDSGAAYGYVDRGRGLATTAIGLLCRMYLGWKHDDPALQRGVEFLSQQGPSQTNMYYNYYATQAMIQYEGEPWEKWNAKMKPQLVSTQSKNGHETGSWYFDERGHITEKGGRLYCTSMACMTLEVYYRFLPIYKQESTKDDFVE